MKITMNKYDCCTSQNHHIPRHAVCLRVTVISLLKNPKLNVTGKKHFTAHTQYFKYELLHDTGTCKIGFVCLFVCVFLNTGHRFIQFESNCSLLFSFENFNIKLILFSVVFRSYFWRNIFRQKTSTSMSNYFSFHLAALL